MRFNNTPGKHDEFGQPYPGFNFYYANNFPITPPPDDMALLPLPYGRFYVSGRIYLDSLGNKAHLVRMMPDGSVDTTFTPRIVNAPLSGKTSHMMFYDEERVMVGGNFNTFEGHVSPHMVRVFLDGSIDTTFTSEFVERYFTSARYVDDVGRIMITDPAGGFASHPEDTVLVMRVLPDGREDTTFHHLEIEGGITAQNSYWWPAVIGVVPEDDGGYVIYGTFTEIDGHTRNGIAKIDSTGQLDLNVFANQSGAIIDYDAHSWIVPWDNPRVNIAIRTPDGGLLVGGLFTHFNGVPHYNLVKLKKVPQYTSVNENNAPELLVFPNPANAQVTFSCKLCTPQTRPELRIYDITGRIMETFHFGDNYEGQVLWDTQNEKPGMYFYQLWQNDEQVHSGKIVVQH